MVVPNLTNGGEEELDRLSEIAGNRTEQERSAQQVNNKLRIFKIIPPAEARLKLKQTKSLYFYM